MVHDILPRDRYPPTDNSIRARLVWRLRREPAYVALSSKERELAEEIMFMRYESKKESYPWIRECMHPLLEEIAEERGCAYHPNVIGGLTEKEEKIFNQAWVISNFIRVMKATAMLPPPEYVYPPPPPRNSYADARAHRPDNDDGDPVEVAEDRLEGI